MCHLGEAAYSHIGGATTAKALQYRPGGLVGVLVGGVGRHQSRLCLLWLSRFGRRRGLSFMVASLLFDLASGFFGRYLAQLGPIFVGIFEKRKKKREEEKKKRRRGGERRGGEDY